MKRIAITLLFSVGVVFGCEKPDIKQTATGNPVATEGSGTSSNTDVDGPVGLNPEQIESCRLLGQQIVAIAERCTIQGDNDSCKDQNWFVKQFGKIKDRYNPKNLPKNVSSCALTCNQDSGVCEYKTIPENPSSPKPGTPTAKSTTDKPVAAKPDAQKSAPTATPAPTAPSASASGAPK